uniref:G-protein coupled receptors family 1 profile domain-containing protein n=1 Tax=Trichobilharzia regenti TaxID=157069 RepID=A0AA85KF06_TRIRE|nr:unnamed protein product [Trichobilharzia regenti]
MESVEADEESLDYYHYYYDYYFSNTSKTNYPHDSIVWMYAAPILIVIGVTENILSLIILLRKHFKNLPSRFTLMTLAIIDSLVLFFGLIRYWINGVFETHPNEWSELWYGDNGRHRSYSMIPLRSNYRTNSNPENPTTIFSTLKSCQKESTGIANVMSYATKRHLRITKMLLIVTFAFLICNLPFAIIHVIRTADETRRSYSWNKAWLISYLLVYINNCMNFPIYIISQPPFRSELKEMFYRYSKRETMTQHHATSPVIG